MFGQPLDFIPNPHRYSGTGAIDDPPLNLSKKKRDVPRIRKPPEAPKRFKSSYILFFMAKQKEIKEELGEGASVSACFMSKIPVRIWMWNVDDAIYSFFRYNSIHVTKLCFHLHPFV